MSRKQLISWYLIPFFNFLSFFIYAQAASNSVSDYYFLNEQQQNFSVLAWSTVSNVSLFSHNQFLLKELCTVTISGNYNIKENTIALSVSHFGYSKYGMFTISSGYARTFAKRVSFGLQVHYLLHHVEDYPRKHSFTFDLSLYGKISQKVGIGVSAYNPANLKYGLTGKEKIPMQFCLMLDYKLSTKVLLAVAVSKQLPGFFDVVGAICFRDRFYGFLIDASVRKVNTKFSFWWKKMQFDVGGSFDYRLGFSPAVRIGWLF